MYNVVEGLDLDELSESGVGYDGLNGFIFLDGYDNLVYEESFNFGLNESGVGCVVLDVFFFFDVYDNLVYE